MKIVTTLRLLLLLSLCFFAAKAQRPGVVSGMDTNSTIRSTERIQESLDHQLAELSQQITSKIEAGQRRTIAVLEFTDLQGNVTDFGRYLAEELITRLYQTDKFKVIERQLLNKVIAEQKLSLTGVIDQASAKQLGKLLGVDAIVSGTIANLSQSLKINARLISTQTGEIFAVASTEVNKDETVTGLMLGRNGVAQSSSKDKATPESEKGTIPHKVSSNVYTVEVKSCRMSGGNVICELLITNDSLEDRQLQLSAKNSKLIDQSGNAYEGVTCNLGAWIGRRNYYSGNAIATLVSKVPTKGNIRFENISAEATTSTLSLFGWPQFKVTLRNIQVTR